MGGEYKAFLPYLTSKGIQIRFSCPHTHQQNGVAERKHRHIVKTGLTLLAHAKMPLKFWVETFSTAVFVINNLSSPLLHFISPYEKLYHKKPNYSFLKTFGCSCYPYLRYYSKHKLDFHTSKCLFIGYSNMHKGYQCLHPSGRVFISRHAEFNELEFPFHDLFPSTTTSYYHHSIPSLPISFLHPAQVPPDGVPLTESVPADVGAKTVRTHSTGPPPTGSPHMVVDLSNANFVNPSNLHLQQPHISS
ncbi:hypothetical protein ACOSP7_005299 [Xanthoceras sorbifolium]